MLGIKPRSNTQLQSCSAPPPGPIQDRLMPKLQKRVSPSLGGNKLPGSFDGGPRYESLPYNTKQPIPVTPMSGLPVETGTLTGTNFYASAPASAFSSISPLQSPPFNIATMAPVHESQRPTSSRSSIDIRKLDGSPYPSEKAPKQIKVAKDMHEGAVPPAYGQTSTVPSHQRPADGHGCSKPSCTKCGKRKTMTAEQQTSPTSSRTVPHYSRPISQGSTLAGPSSMPVGQPLKKCHKCGKHKKPILAPLPPQPVFSAQHRFSSQSTIVPSPVRPQQPSLSLLAGDNLPQPPVPQFEVIPPSASTYRRVESAMSNYTDQQPLVKHERNNSYQAFRPVSLIRSLSRRSSNKSRSGPPTPGSDAGEQQSSGGFMGLIRNQSTRDYRKLDPSEQPSRPHSPAFSYMETANEDAFEMRPMTGANKELGSPASEGSLQSPTGEERASKPTHYHSTSIQPEGDLMLAIPEQGGDNRPQLTRFKSLRSGVSRAASTVSRSGSLKRLGSIHQAFYRDDLSLDAHNDGDRGTVAAF